MGRISVDDEEKYRMIRIGGRVGWGSRFGAYGFRVGFYGRHYDLHTVTGCMLWDV